MIDDEECGARLAEMKRRGCTDFYMMEVGPDEVIDATRKGNYSRLINHSCAPNCRTEKWYVARLSCHSALGSKCLKYSQV